MFNKKTLIHFACKLLFLMILLISSMQLATFKYTQTKVLKSYEIIRRFFVFTKYIIPETPKIYTNKERAILTSLIPAFNNQIVISVTMKRLYFYHFVTLLILTVTCVILQLHYYISFCIFHKRNLKFIRWTSHQPSCRRITQKAKTRVNKTIHLVPVPIFTA